MSAHKPHILLQFWYDRADLIAPFLALSDQFRFTLLFYRFPSQEKKAFADTLPFPRIYWTDFASPYDLLDQVKPDKICMMGIEGFLTIGLLTAARLRGIPTAYINHGLTDSYQALLRYHKNAKNEQLDERYNPNNPAYKAKKIHGLLFMLRSLRPANVYKLPFFVRMVRATRSYPSIVERLYHVQSRHRLADRYIVYSSRFADMLKERDGLTEDRIVEIGPYNSDPLFQQLLRPYPPAEREYFLLIDQPLDQLTRAEKDAFVHRLYESCRLQGKELWIKLHPVEYQRPDLPLQESIHYIRQHDDIATIILQSAGILGYYSAMLLPILYFKKCILFRASDTPLMDEWSKMGIARVLPFPNFDAQDLDFSTLHISEESRSRYLNEHIKYADGQGTARLGAAIAAL